jgi:hypothetical protein
MASPPWIKRSCTELLHSRDGPCLWGLYHAGWFSSGSPVDTRRQPRGMRRVWKLPQPYPGEKRVRRLRRRIWGGERCAQTPVIGTRYERGNTAGRTCTETQCTKCAASQHEKESERSSPGSLTYPVHTGLSLPSNGSQTSKEGGEWSMPGKRHQRVKLSSTSVSV